MWCRYLPQIGILYHENLHSVTFYKSSRLKHKTTYFDSSLYRFQTFVFSYEKKAQKIKKWKMPEGGRKRRMTKNVE